MSDEKTAIIKVERLVGSSDLSEDDRYIEPLYQVTMDNDVPFADMADTVLDVFHDTIAVDELDDFEFTVWYNGVELTPNENHESYSFKNDGWISD